MKRVAIIIAAALTTLLSPVTPAHAAPPLACTAGSYSDLRPPYHTHWLIGQRTYGGGVIPVTTYRYWLHEDTGSVPPRFLGVTYAQCSWLSGEELPLEPVSATFGRPCTEPTDYHTIVADRVINYRFVGALRSPPSAPPWGITNLYRFWIRESEGRYLDSSVARCQYGRGSLSSSAPA